MMMPRRMFPIVALALALALPAFAQEKPSADVGPLPAAPKTADVPAAMAAQVTLHQLDARIWSLQGENAQLRARIADLTARLDSAALNAQGELLRAAREQLEAELRTAVGAPKDAAVDWGDHQDQPDGHKGGHAPVVTWTPEKPKG